MTDLHALLVRRIAQTGPITIADFMVECLTHPLHGYYMHADRFGKDGDFVTSPEVSQMFGELIGLCLAQIWLDQGKPDNIILCELGPGRGTLMADALRATKAVPGFHDSLTVHMVEVSPALRHLQGQNVPNALWHDSLATLPNGPLFLIANEFFDALPIRQFVRKGDGWCERMVGVQNEQLYFGLSDPAPIDTLRSRLADTKDGDIVEVCPGIPGIVELISQQIAAQGGAALIIDYGDWQSLGDTFQAVQNHQHCDPLMYLGSADLTAHVDFAIIAKHTEPAEHTRLTTQGIFLERLGITDRANALAKNLTGDLLNSHIAAHRRLTHPAEMGDLFRVIGIYPATASAPPGLEP